LMGWKKKLANTYDILLFKTKVKIQWY
jgi:hypothetical protein